MALKNAKLREQHEANALQAVQRSELFAGVVIYVNGHTVPSAMVRSMACKALHVMRTNCNRHMRMHVCLWG